MTDALADEIIKMDIEVHELKEKHGTHDINI